MVIQNFAEEETINFPEIIKKFISKFFLERPSTSEFTSTPLIFLHHTISFYAERHRIAPHSIAAVLVSTDGVLRQCQRFHHSFLQIPVLFPLRSSVLFENAFLLSLSFF